jgi:hypothetical protein
MADPTSPAEPVADIEMGQEEEAVHEGHDEDAMGAIEAEVPVQVKFLE